MKTRKSIGITALVFCLCFSCTPASQLGKIQNWNDLGWNESAARNQLTVVTVIDIHCPISIYAIQILRSMNSRMSDPSVRFIAVLPGDYYSKREIRDFKLEHDMNFDLVTDKKMIVVDRLQATITPECYVIDAGQNILYSGALDDKYKALGQSILQPSVNYVESALEAARNGKPVAVARTEPVGCRIELMDKNK